MPPRRKRKDENHASVVRHLVAVGATVTDLSDVGGGCPDLLVGFRRANYLLEIKDGSKSASRRKLTWDQVLYHSTWQGQVCVVCDEKEALRAIGAKIRC